MNYIKNAKFKKLIKDIDVKDIVEDLGLVYTKSGRDFMTECPFHTGSRQSFGICFSGDGKGLCRCLHADCSIRCTIFHVIAQIEGVELKSVLKRYDIDYDPKVFGELRIKFRKSLSKNKKKVLKKISEKILNKFEKPSGEYLRYLTGPKRKLTKASINKFGILACTKGMWSGRVIFPMRDEEGNLISLTARSIDPHVEKKNKIRKVKDSDVKKILFGLNFIAKYAEKYRKGVFVEGESDVYYLIQNKIPTVGLGNADIDARQKKLIIKYFDDIIILFDGDVDLNSWNNKKKISELRKLVSAKVVKLPPNKDPNEMPEKYLEDFRKKYFPEIKG